MEKTLALNITRKVRRGPENYLQIEQAAKIITDKIDFTELSLWDIAFEEKEFNLLVDILTLSKKKITSLKILGCNLSACKESDIERWMNSWEFLESIVIEDSHFHKSFYCMFEKVIKQKSLKKIVFDIEGLGHKVEYLSGCYNSLLNVLQSATSLEHLGIDGPDGFNEPFLLAPEGKLIAEIIKNNPKLHTLSLNGLGINDECLDEILLGLYQNSTLKRLNLGANLISDFGASKLSFYIKEKHNLLEFAFIASRVEQALVFFADITKYNPFFEKLELLDEADLPENNELNNAFRQKFYDSVINSPTSMIHSDMADALFAFYQSDIPKGNNIFNIFKNNKARKEQDKRLRPEPTKQQKLQKLLGDDYTISPNTLFSIVSFFFRKYPSALKTEHLPEEICSRQNEAHSPYIISKKPAPDLSQRFKMRK